MPKAKKWVLVRHFDGEPKDGDLELQEEDLPELKDGDILLEGECWSVDPYMRGGSRGLPVGSVMLGQHFARVAQSKNSKYPVGSYMMSQSGWRSATVCNPDTHPLPPSRYPGAKPTPVFSKVPELGDIPKTLTLGVLGMPGATAYFGLLELCKPKAGETVLVSGAAGAVGSIVGQIAKIKGCKVIGFAGTDDKVKYLKDELGFDFAFNYKTDDVTASLNKAAPDGIDCYFDNVGGTFTTTVIIQHMKTFGRIAVCGNISRYNEDPTKPAQGPEVYGSVLFKQLRMEGFIVTRWIDRWGECIKELGQWIKQGKLKYRETKTVGFENMYGAFRSMLKGGNTGKAIIVAGKSS